MNLRDAAPTPRRTACACLFLMLAACGGTQFDPSSAIPASVTAVGRFHLGDLVDEGRNSWAAEMLRDIENNEDYRRLREEIGLDPLEDVDEVHLGVGEDADSGEFIAVLQGTFDSARVIEGLQLQEGYATETIAGRTIHYLRMETGDRVGFYFPGDGIAVAMGELWAPTCIETLDGTRDNVTSNEDMQSLIDHVDRTDSAWLVAKVPKEGLPGTDNPMVAGFAGDIRALMFSADLSAERDVHLAALVRTGRPATAANLEATVSGFLQMGRAMIATQAPETAALLGEILFSSEGNIARAELHCSADRLDAVRAEMERLQTAGIGAPSASQPPEEDSDEHEDPFADDPFFEDEQDEPASE